MRCSPGFEPGVVLASAVLPERKRRWPGLRRRWIDSIAPIEVDRFKKGAGGHDISPLMAQGVPGLGLSVNRQRYFDVHHSAKDRIDAVDGRELELGAIAMAIMSYMLAEEGLPEPRRGSDLTRTRDARLNGSSRRRCSGWLVNEAVID
jgi:hypothetical protein